MKKTIIGLNALMVFVLLLTACAPAATPAPTVDANQLFTQAAQTVIAQLTKNAPTATQIPTATKGPLASGTPLGGALPTLPPLATLPSLSTPTKSSLNIADKAIYITQSPSDNGTVPGGKVFNVTWRLRNTGTTTWNNQYVYRFYAAANKLPTAANGYNLTTSVAPNGEVDLTVVATAPTSAGVYDTQWVLTNPEGVNFMRFTLTVNVTAGSTTTGTTATEAAPPDECADKNYSGVPHAIPANGTWNGNPPSDPLIKQGGRMRITYTVISGSTSTFTVSDARGSYGPFQIGSGGTAIFGNPDELPHEVTITTSGSDILTITEFVSVNSNKSCF